jgi:hypothetical protein
MARERIRLRIWLAALLVTLGTAAVMALVLRAPGGRRRAPATAESAGSTGAVTASSPLFANPAGKARLPSTLEELIDEYARSAADPSAQEDRAAVLAAIFSEPDPSRRLYAVLAATARDQTAPEADPLWPRVAAGLSQLWQSGMARRGLDLMVAETRPRARQAIISSFAYLASSGGVRALSVGERTVLTNNFIDLYAQFPAMQRDEMQQALRATGDRDVADILQGKGLADDALEIHRARKQALERAVHASASP